MNATEQKAFFEAFGYLHVRQAFSEKEMDEISREAGRLWDEEGREASFGEQGQVVSPFAELSPTLTDMVADDRVYGTAENLLGPDFLWAGSEGNVTVRGTHPWHPDRPGDAEELSYTRLKLNVYLDPVNLDNGCLRVIPGSHRTPLHEEIEPKRRHQMGETVEPFGVAGPDIPSVALESRPGDLCFFNQSIWHAIFNGWPGRRFIALKFAARPTTDKHVASLRHYAPESTFEPADTFLHNDDPRMRKMVEPLPEIGSRDVPEFVPFGGGYG